MDWDQRAFAWIYRSFKRIVGDDAQHAEEAPLDVARARLELLARLLSGTAWEVVGADDDGGVAPGQLTLPRQPKWISGIEAHAPFYLYRLIFGLTASELGFRAMPGSSDVKRATTMLLSVPTTERALRDRYPGIEPVINGFRDSASAFPFSLRSEQSQCLAHAAQALLDVSPTTTPSGNCVSVAQRIVEAARQDDVLARQDELAAALDAELTPLRAARNDEIRLPWGVFRDASAPTMQLETAEDLQTHKASSGTERENRKRSERAELVDLESQRDRDNPVVHSFEKVHTADEYRSGRKQVDGSDELAEHEEALDELTLDKVVRTKEAASSVYRADLETPTGAGEIDEAAPDLSEHRYREWNYQSRSYRDNWCTVHESSASTAPPRVVAEASRRLHRHVLELQAELRSLEFQRRWRNRQRDGTDVDIDALVDRQATLSARRTPDARVYMRRRRHDADLALLILIDASLSADSWTSGSRVLDITRDAAQVVIEAIEPLAPELCVSAFYSNTRRDCRFLRLKRFGEPWSVGLRRLHAVEPNGYTRVGPALRHAATVLEGSGARRRVIVLVTDAKPTDYDRYEGRYGVEDVRQAIIEAEYTGIECVAWAVRSSGNPFLSRMFGRRGWALMPDVSSVRACFAKTISPRLNAR